MEGIEDQDWRKSSYSGNGGGNCAELASNGQIVAVRDTKQHGVGPVLKFSTASWHSFIDKVKTGKLLAGQQSRVIISVR
jgi:hypothetical protein